MLALISIILSGIFLFSGEFEFISEHKAISRHFYTDHHNNIYFLDNHKIVKLEPAKGRVSEYGSLSDGRITSADVSNPFQILLFYRDFNRIVFLDNRLSTLRPEVNLRQLGVEQAALVCSSGSGGFWVYCERDDRLFYFDQLLQKVYQSRSIRSLSGTDVRPLVITEEQNRVFMLIPGTGLLVFDRFASFLKPVLYEGTERFKVYGNNIVYFSDGKLYSLGMDTGSIYEIALPGGFEIDDADIQRELFFLLSGDRLLLYRSRF